MQNVIKFTGEYEDNCRAVKSPALNFNHLMYKAASAMSEVNDELDLLEGFVEAHNAAVAGGGRQVKVNSDHINAAMNEARAIKAAAADRFIGMLNYCAQVFNQEYTEFARSKTSAMFTKVETAKENYIKEIAAMTAFVADEGERKVKPKVDLVAQLEKKEAAPSVEGEGAASSAVAAPVEIFKLNVDLKIVQDAITASKDILTDINKKFAEIADQALHA